MEPENSDSHIRDLLQQIKSSNISKVTKSTISEIIKTAITKEASSLTTSRTPGEESSEEELDNTIVDQTRNGTMGDDQFKMLRKPEEFNGEPPKARKWIEDFKFCAKVNLWDNELAAKRLPAFLGGSARNWYTMSIEGSEIEKDFKGIEEQFNLLFLPKSIKIAIADELDKRKQRTDEPVSNFIIDMRLLCRDYDKSMPEAEVVNKIRNRVLSSFEPNLTQANPTTIQKLVEVCIAIEEGNRKRDSGNGNVNAVTHSKAINCYSCGARGHSARECTAQRNTIKNSFRGKPSGYKQNNSFRNASRPTGRFNDRHQQRHPDNRTHKDYNGNRRDNDNNRNSNEVTCFNCGGKGHLSKICPSIKVNANKTMERPRDHTNKYDNNVNRYQRQNKDNLLAYIMPESAIYVDIYVNTTKLRALVDTGATVTCIESKLAKDINLELVPTTVGSLRTANGSSMRKVSQAVVKLRLVVDKKNIENERDIVVCEGLPVDVILGLDTLTDLGLVVDCPKKKLVRATSKKNDEENAENACFMLYTTTIPPRSSAVIDVAVDGDPQQEVILCPTKSRNNVIFPSSVNTVENGRTKTVALNPTNAPIDLSHGLNIANWTIANDEPAEENKSGEINMIKQVDSTTHIEVGDQLGSEQTEELVDLVREYREVFSDGSRLGCTSKVKHKIELTDPTPFEYPLRRLAYKEKDLIQEQIKDMIDKEVITESQSPFSSPMVLVKKRDGSTRFCIDFRKLNSRTKKWVFPLPNQEDILEAGSGAEYFTTLDLNSGYWQLPMDEESRQYTAFSTYDNHYEFLRMPMGLSNAAASFSKLMSTVMSGLVGQAVHIYLDDLIIMSRTWKEHIQNIANVLKKIKDANLTVKLAKCKFAFDEAEILGHVLSKDGIKPQPNKLASIERLPPPANVEEVRQVLGMTGYYRKFVPTFAAITGPMADLTRKDVPFKWTIEEQESFDQLKKALLSSKAIAYFRQNGPVIIKTDASRKGLAGILLQHQDGEWRIVATTSRRVSRSEENFNVTELEGAALIEALQKFRPYVYGRRVKIIVDHCALCALAREKPLQGRLARWAIFLSSYDIEIEYKSGKQHADVDCLSRQPVANEDDRLDESKFVYAIIPLEDYTSKYRTDKECREALASIQKGEKIFKLTKGHIYRDNRLLVPVDFRGSIIDNLHKQGHAGIEQTIGLISQKYYWSALKEDVKKKVAACTVCQTHKVPRVKPSGLMNSFNPSKPFEMLCLDHIGPLDTTRKGHKHILVAVDAFSKLIIATPTKSTASEEIVKFIIDNIVAVHGVPCTLFSDNASGFKSKLTAEVCEAFGIELEHSTPHHHTGNALIERAIQTLKDKIAMAVSTNTETEWDDQVGMMCLAINATKHSTSNYTPYETVYGRKLRLPGEPREMNEGTDLYTESIQAQLELIRRNVSESLNIRAEASKKYYDAKHKETKYEIDDEVLVYFDPKVDTKCNKFSARYRGPYKVVQVRANDIYKLELIDKKKTIMVHVSRMKPFIRQANETEEYETEIIDLDENTEEEQGNEEPKQVERPHNRRKQNIAPRNYASLALMFLLATIISTADASLFAPTESVIWTKSKIKPVRGLDMVQLNWSINNPCDRLFKNITKDAVLNENLLDHCNELYEEKIKGEFKVFCGDIKASSRERRMIGDVLSITMSATSLIMVADIKKNEIPYLKGSINQLREVVTDHGERINELDSQLMLIKASILQEHTNNQNNMKILNDKINQVRVDLRASSEAAYLMSRYIAKIGEIHENIKDAKYYWHEGKVSRELFEMMDITEHYTEDINSFGSPLLCKIYNNTMMLYFSNYRSDQTSIIMEANSFDFLNGTRDKTCTMVYVAPKLAIVNITAGCYKSITQREVMKENIVLNTCNSTNKIKDNDKWEATRCGIFEKSHYIDKIDLFYQVRKDGFNHIYCYPNRIRIENDEAECPPFPFKIPEEQSFTTGGHVYIAERRVIKGDLNIEIAKSKINFMLNILDRPLVFHELTALKNSKNLTLANAVEWMKEVNSTIITDLLSKQIPSINNLGITNIWQSLFYFGIGIALLFVVSFVMPIITLLVWITRRAIIPIRVINHTFRQGTFLSGQERNLLPIHGKSPKKVRLLL